MPTTNPRIAIGVLESLQAAGIDFALLQQPDALLSNEPTGDIDIVVGIRPRLAVEKAAAALRARGIALVALWPYDVGGTATTFFFDSEGVDGAQVDMLFDEEGLGHYSVRSRALLESAAQVSPFPIVSPLELAIYMFSKRSWKRQEAKLHAVRLQIDSAPEAAVADAVRRVVTSGELATRIARHPLHVGRKPVGLIPRLRRIVSRIAAPVGFWVHCPGDRGDLAQSLATRIGNVLVHSATGRLPRNLFSRWSWYWRAVQPIRLRPGIFVSWGSISPGPGTKPDLTIAEGRAHEDALVDVIQAMSTRHGRHVD